MTMQLLKIIREPAVLKASGKGRSTFRKEIPEGLFTKPVRVSKRSVGWPEHEVAAINAARISGKSDEEIKALVRRLESARKDIAEAA